MKRAKHANALPLIITHGWPGSIIEQMKIIDPLTNPTAYGGSASDAFDVVIPSLPGYGFSGKPLGYLAVVLILLGVAILQYGSRGASVSNAYGRI